MVHKRNKMVYIFHSRILTFEVLKLLMNNGYEPVQIKSLADCEVDELFVFACDDSVAIGKITGDRWYQYLWVCITSPYPKKIEFETSPCKERIIIPDGINSLILRGLMKSGQVFSRWVDVPMEYMEGDIKVSVEKFPNEEHAVKTISLQRTIKLQDRECFKTFYVYKRADQTEPYPISYPLHGIVLEALPVDESQK
jgi:hypothetical protein